MSLNNYGCGDTDSKKDPDNKKADQELSRFPSH